MADIVIRGMEIPKEPTNITIYPDGCWCDYTSNDSHGKFVVLPEGHGRLGDLDTAESILYSKAFDLCKYFGEHDGVMWALRQIEALPIILEAEGDDKE